MVASPVQRPDEPCFEALWPLSRKAVQPGSLARRLPDLNGRNVCEIWDGIFRGEVMFPLLRAHLKARFPDVRFTDSSNFGNFYGARDREVLAALPDKLREHRADAAIVGIGA